MMLASFGQNLNLAGGLDALHQQVAHERPQHPLCTICGATEGGKNVKRDHATSVGLLLNDLCGLEGTQVTRYHSLDTMISKIKYMVANTPPEQRESMWRVGDRPLCNSFVCPCCGRLLPATEANAHMVAALTAIEKFLDEQSRRRFGASKQRGDLAARRAMREMLLVQIANFRPTQDGGTRGGSENRSPLLETGKHWCGSPPMTPEDQSLVAEYQRFFLQMWTQANNHETNSSSGRPPSQLPGHSALPAPAASGNSGLGILAAMQASYGKRGIGADAFSSGSAGPVDALQQLRQLGAPPLLFNPSYAAGGSGPREAPGSFSVGGSWAPSASVAANAPLPLRQRNAGGGSEPAASRHSEDAGLRSADAALMENTSAALASGSACIDGSSRKRQWEDAGNSGGVGPEHAIPVPLNSSVKRTKLDTEQNLALENAIYRGNSIDKEGDRAAGLDHAAAWAQAAVEDATGGARHGGAARNVEEEEEEEHLQGQQQQQALRELRSGPVHPAVEQVQQIEYRHSLPVLLPQAPPPPTAPAQQAAQQPFMLRLAPLPRLPPQQPENDEEAKPQVEVVQRVVLDQEPQPQPQEGRREQPQVQPEEQALQQQQQADRHRDNIQQQPRSLLQQQAHTSESLPAPHAGQQAREQHAAGLEQQLRPDRGPDEAPDQALQAASGPMHSSLANALRAAMPRLQRPDGLREVPAEAQEPQVPSWREASGPEALGPGPGPGRKLQWQSPRLEAEPQALRSAHAGVKLEGEQGDVDEDYGLDAGQAAAGPGLTGPQACALPPQLMLQGGGFGAGLLPQDGAAALSMARSSGGMERSRASGGSLLPEASPEPEASLPKRRRPLQACPSCHKVLSHAQYYVHLADIKRAGNCRGAERAVTGLMGGRVRFDGRVASVPPLRFGAGPADSAAAASSQPLLEAAADTTMITGSSPPDPFAAATARGPLLPPALQNTIPLPPMLPPLSPGLPPAQALPLLLPPAPLPGAEGLGVPTGGAVAAGPSSSSLLLPGRDSELQPPPPGSWAPASSAPAPQDFDAVEGDVRCSICKIQEGGKNLERDHATSMGFLLCDLCGVSEALVSRSHTVDAMREEVKLMRLHTPPSQQLLWQVGGKPLCCCFVCPCCNRLLPSGDANKHMVAALDAVYVLLSEADKARFTDKLKTRGDLAARRAMREMLLEGPVDRWAEVQGLRLCGSPPMTRKEVEAQQGYASFLQTLWHAATGMPDDGRLAAMEAAVMAVSAAAAAAADAVDSSRLLGGGGDGGGGGVDAAELTWQSPAAQGVQQLPTLPQAGSRSSGGTLAPASLGAGSMEDSQFSHPAADRGAPGMTGPGSQPPPPQQRMPALPLPGVLPTGLEVPGQHHAGGIRLVSECAVCGHSPNWPELQLGQWPPIYHLRAVALILNDALHMPDLLRLAEADPDTAKKVVGAMCSPAGTRSPWQLAGKPLCCCFPCPCCERVLPYGTAHRHMLAALLHPQVWKQLTPRQHARVQQIEQLPQPADTLLGAAPHDVMPPELSAMDCLELMRGMLLGVMAVHHSALRGTERCLCGADRMTELEVIEQRAALAGLQAAGTSLAAASELPSSRQGSAAAVAAVAAATAAAATAAAAAATAPAGRGVVEAGEAAVSQRVPLALPPPGMAPSGLEDMPSLLQQAARAATQSWPPLPAGGGRPGLPGAVARAPPLPTSLLAGGAGLRLQQQRQLVDMNQRAAGALAADGDSSGRRGQPHYGAGAGGSVEPALVYGGGRAVSLGNGRAGPPGETGQRGWDPPMGALLQHLARASASTQPTAAPAARPPAAAAAAPSAPQRRPPPRPTVDEAAGPLDGLEEQGGVPGGGAGASASLQLVTALLKQLPREQLQHVLREVKAEADDDLAAGAGEAGAAGGTPGANIPPYLAEQLAASGVDLTSRPVQAPRQQQRQRQGRNVAPASSSVAGPGPAGGALGAGRGSSGQRSRQQDRDAAEEDALSVLMTLRDQGM